MRRFAQLGLALIFLAVPLGHESQALIWPSAARSIESELGSPDVGVRRRAAARLDELSGAALRRAVLRALEDPDVEVRLAAARAGRDEKLTNSGDRVMAWLTEPDPRLRLAAAEVLTRAPSPRAVAPLSRALSDTEASVRRAAARALGASGAKEAVIGLLGRLDDPAVEVRESVIRALADIGDPRAVVPLISKIEEGRPEIRRAVARALGVLGDPRAVSALVVSLRDADADVRASALDALGELAAPASAASIAGLLANENSPTVRRAAIEALARLVTPEATSALVDALGSLSDEREALIAAFARMGPTAAPALETCVRASGPEERVEGCALALAATHAPSAGAVVREALERGSIGPEAALTALAEVSDPEALPKCLSYLNHPDPGVRRAALAAAGALLDPHQADGRAVEPLELSFAQAKGRRAERLELLRLLGRTGSPRATRLLVPIAEHADDLEFRTAALSAIAELGPSAAPATLLKVLDDPEPAVRLTAALAIRKSAPAGLARALVERLETSAAQDRAALALALSGALRASDTQEIARVVTALDGSRGDEREALIEALGHAASASAARGALRALAASVDPADRAKSAEALGLSREADPVLLSLAADHDASVRANAVWGLGGTASARDIAVVDRAASDVDVAVAANGAAALGRIGERSHVDVSARLCALSADSRSAVRANALLALRLVGKRCSDERELRALTSDPSSRVRAAAARLLRDVAPQPADVRALRRCVKEEPSGEVAAACTGTAEEVRRGTDEVLVFVVPTGEAQPVSRAPFALVRPDGLIRFGTSDRRGALCEPLVADGELALGPLATVEE